LAARLVGGSDAVLVTALVRSWPKSIVPESLLTSGVVAEGEYTLARSRILNRIIDRIPKEKDQVTD
jgi:hypothetical protein